MPEFELPEFTRSLRTLAVPSAPGSDHDLVLGPLLQARALAHRAQSLEAQLAAFDAARLDRAWRVAIATLAEARHRRSPSDCRALEAELEFLAAPLWEALGAVAAAAERARLARADERPSAWNAWVERLRVLFRAADDWWTAAVPVLAAAEARGGPSRRRASRQPSGQPR